MRHSWQTRLYQGLWIAMLAGGAAGIARLLPSLGRGFGGFIWQYNHTQGHTVSFEAPRHWPGPQAGLTPHTQICAIDGRSPSDFPTVYGAKPIGAPVTYDIVRTDGRTDRVVVPLTRFTPQHLAEGYGTIFLIGLTFSTAGYVLLRSAKSTGRVLLAYVMLVGADTALYHGHNGNINRFYNRPIFPAVMGAPSNGALGALLFHLALVYPRPLPLVDRHRWIVPLAYTLGLGLGVVYGSALYFGENPRFARIEPPAQRVSMALLTLGVAATIARGAWELAGRRDELSPTERRQVEIMAAAWTIAALVLLGTLGAANLPVSVPLELLTAVGTVLPIALVYAIHNADMIAELEEQSDLRGQLLVQIDDLQRLRARALDEFADVLHDSAIADSKALELRLYTILRQMTEGQIDGAALRVALADLHEQGVQLGRTLRQTVEGVKPVDLHAETLTDVLDREVRQLNATGETRYTLVRRGEIDALPIAVTEAIYWIARAALNNVRDHAGAQACTVTVERTSDRIRLSIGDDGRGSVREIGAASQPPRRRLGVPAMRARATRLGGQLDVVNGPQGTMVTATLPIQASSV